MRGRVSRRAGLAALRVLPRSGLSRLAGRVARLRLPERLRAPVLRLFGRMLGVDFTEVRDPLDRYESLQAFFTRALEPGARPIDPAPDALLAPCDGAWGESGRVRDGTLLQVKGRRYALAELLGDTELAERFEDGWFATFYLSPRDYHRFHGCCDLSLRELRYLPGDLWPVNRLGVEGVEALFARNERIALLGQLESSAPGRGEAAAEIGLVAVGATLVGCVRLAFDDFSTGGRTTGPSCKRYPEPGLDLQRGQEWGRFEFGSTLILLSSPGAVELEPRPSGTPLRVGTRIGRVLGSTESEWGAHPGALGDGA